MYVNLKELAHILNIFDDSEPVYFGRSGTFPEAPRAVLKGLILVANRQSNGIK